MYNVEDKTKKDHECMRKRMEYPRVNGGRGEKIRKGARGEKQEARAR